jgi:hypothetical protein
MLIFASMLRKLLILTLLLCNLHVAAQKNKQKAVPDPMSVLPVNYREPGSILPPMNVMTMDNKKITNADVANDANFFLMLFNPTCDHCERQTDSLREHIGLFKKSKLVLVATPITKTYVPSFIQGHKLENYPQIQVGIDSALCDRTFVYMSLPQINIYNKDRVLIKIFSGNVAIDSLKKYIE